MLKNSFFIKIVFTLLIIIFMFSSISVLAISSIYIWSDMTDAVSTVAPSDDKNTNNTVVNNTKSNNTQNIDNMNNTNMDSTQPTSNIDNFEQNSSNSENSLSLESGSAILIEQKSGEILYEHNSHDKLLPASVTKVMSILLIMEAIDEGRINFEDKIPCSSEASKMGGSQIWLDVNESLTVDEMLKAICVVSANDCTVAMAEYLGGSQQGFVEQMNTRAKELGMNDTTFKNCHGIDEEGHLTSSHDIALMSRELLNKYPDITKYTTIWMDSLREGTSELVNTNKLIRNYQGATGLKTGSTSMALYNLSASATRNELSLISVIMKAPTTAIRFAEAQKLLDYGFSNYSYKEFGKKNDIIKTLNVNKGLESSVNAILEEDSGMLMKKGKDKDIVQDILLEENISAPVSKGQKLGEITFSVEGNVISTTNIVSDNNIEKINLLNMSLSVFSKWFRLLR